MKKERWRESEKRREEKRKSQSQKKENQRRERVRRKKTQAHEKVEKSQNTVVFQCFAAPEGRRVGSLKRRQVRDQTLLSAVARRRFGGQNVKSTPIVGALLEVSPLKSARGCGAKHVSKLKWHSKIPHCRSTFGRFWKLSRWKKCTARGCGAKHVSKW